MTNNNLLDSPLQVYKILPQTNCQKCYLPSCLAFAAAVIRNEKELKDCPDLDHSIYSDNEKDKSSNRTTNEEELDKKYKVLQAQVNDIEFASRTESLGTTMQQDKMVVSCLGKNFFVAPTGDITSECHINPWLTTLIFDYIINCQGCEPLGDWVSFRELPDGLSWNPLFLQRCEKPLKKVADNHTDLFENLVDLFSGRQTEPVFDSDIAIVLQPLPKVSVLICYWKPEDDMDSMLNIFFDKNVEKNISIESLYSLSAGLVRMFEKISLIHG